MFHSGADIIHIHLKKKPYVSEMHRSTSLLRGFPDLTAPPSGRLH